MGAVYRLPEGAPVVAVSDAIVGDLGEDLSRGRWIELHTADGLRIRYHHLMRVIGALEPGDAIGQGSLIGLAGHSGKTPSDRLRLELATEEEGMVTVIDPMRLATRGRTRSPRVGVEIPEAQRDRFTKDIAPRRRALEHALR